MLRQAGLTAGRNLFACWHRWLLMAHIHTVDSTQLGCVLSSRAYKPAADCSILDISFPMPEESNEVPISAVLAVVHTAALQKVAERASRMDTAPAGKPGGA